MFRVFSTIIQVLSWSTSIQGLLHPHQYGLTDSPSISPPGKIPGESLLRFCNESRDTDLYAIEHIEVYPNPLYIDDVFEVHLYGTFLEDITTNATWTMLTRGLNVSRGESWSDDFCHTWDSIEQPDPDWKQECPEKGFALIMMSGWVWPMFITPWDYYFKFDAVTKEGKRIYCLETELHLDYRNKGDREGPA